MKKNALVNVNPELWYAKQSWQLYEVNEVERVEYLYIWLQSADTYNYLPWSYGFTVKQHLCKNTEKML